MLKILDIQITQLLPKHTIMLSEMIKMNCELTLKHYLRGKNIATIPSNGK